LTIISNEDPPTLETVNLENILKPEYSRKPKRPDGGDDGDDNDDKDEDFVPPSVRSSDTDSSDGNAVPRTRRLCLR
jgi:hypothetical protein